MNSKLCFYFGNPWVGMFIKTNNEKTFVPLDASEKLIEKIRNNLKTDIVQVSLGDSNLLGIYLSMNSNGIILPNITTKEEVAIMKKIGLNVYICKDKFNAHGNNILVNDKGALVNGHISKNEMKEIEDVLGVELIEGNIANYKTVGSACVAINTGFLAHFAASKEELRNLEAHLNVKGARGSINTGVGFIGYGVLANKHGYVVGGQSTAFEIGRIEESLGYLDK